MQAWSNTTSLGTKASTTYCNNWSTSQIAPKGRLGDASATTGDWTNLSDLNLNPLTCGASLHLYCVEDP